MRSFLTFMLVALTACFALVSALPVTTSYTPVRWRTKFSGSIEADRMYELEWEGGSGDYEVYYIPQWPENDDYASIDIAAKTSSHSIKWRAPPHALYPDGTTFILVVNDAKSGSGSAWYDTSSVMSFVSAQ